MSCNVFALFVCSNFIAHAYLLLLLFRLVTLVDQDLVVEEGVEAKATGTWGLLVDYRSSILLSLLAKLD